MKLLLENWRNFLTEDLLAEGILQDTKKKYPEMSELGHIDKLSAGDPTGRNKYLRWASQELQRFIEEYPIGRIPSHDPYISLIGKTLKQFEQQKARLEEKDINGYTLDSLVSALEAMGKSGSQKKKEKKIQAREDSAVITLDDEDISENMTIIRPLSKEASCHYGAHQTTWCISATKSENYFDRYTADGQAFYFAFLHNFKEDPRLKMLAFVVSPEGQGLGVEDIFNAENDGLSINAAVDIIMRNNIFGGNDKLFKEYLSLRSPRRSLLQPHLKPKRRPDGATKEPSPALKKILDKYEITTKNIDTLNDRANDMYRDIVLQMENNADDQPAGPTEESFKELEKSFNFKHVDVDYYSDLDFGESQYEFNGVMGLDFSSLKWIKDPDDLSDEITDILENIADTHISLYQYSTGADFDDYGSIDSVRLSWNETVRGADALVSYGEFLGEMSLVDELYDEIYQDAVDAFVGKRWIESETYHGLSALSKKIKLENFKVNFDRGNLIFTLGIQEKIPGFQKLTRQYEGGDEAFKINSMSRQMRSALQQGGELIKQFHETIQQIMDDATNTINRQLALPGIEQEEVQKVSPESHGFFASDNIFSQWDFLLGDLKFKYNMNDQLDKVKDEIRFIKELDAASADIIQTLVKVAYNYGKKIVVDRAQANEDTTSLLMGLAEDLKMNKKELMQIIEEEVRTILQEKKKACKPSKGKRFAKRVDGKCRSFGQAGQAKSGGDRIRPGTKKGDAYCARSLKIKKCKNPPCANALSRKKWKCRGAKSVAE